MFIRAAFPSILTVIAIATIFGGWSPVWVTDTYDNWRLLQYGVMVLSVLWGAFFIPNSLRLTVTNQVTPLFLLFGVCMLALLALSAVLSLRVEYAVVELAYAVMIVIYFFVLRESLMRIGEKHRAILLGMVAFLPLLIIVWLFIGVVLFFSQDVPLVWHGPFKNIRYYDDALLPCLLLLWTKPAFWGRQSRFITMIVYAVSTFYLLSLWIDGARAVLSSMSVAIIAAWFCFPARREMLKLPLITLLLSFLLYLGFTAFSEIPPHIARSSSSGRWQMWTTSLFVWLQQPILGIGGQQFVFQPSAVNIVGIAHPHNWVVQFVVEWGIAGLMIVLLLSKQIFLLLKQCMANHDIMYFIAVVAMVLNMLMSGMHVYPQSQILSCFLLAAIVASFKHPKKNIDATKKNKKIGLSLLGIFTVAATTVVLLTTGYGVATEVTDEGGYPRFWQNGTQLLIPLSTVTK